MNVIALIGVLSAWPWRKVLGLLLCLAIFIAGFVMGQRHVQQAWTAERLEQQAKTLEQSLQVAQIQTQQERINQKISTDYETQKSILARRAPVLRDGALSLCVPASNATSPMPANAEPAPSNDAAPAKGFYQRELGCGEVCVVNVLDRARGTQLISIHAKDLATAKLEFEGSQLQRRVGSPNIHMVLEYAQATGVARTIIRGGAKYHAMLCEAFVGFLGILNARVEWLRQGGRGCGRINPALRGDVTADFWCHMLWHEHDAQAHGLSDTLDGRQSRIAFAALDLRQMLWRHARGNRDRFQRQMPLVALTTQG